jgi:transposase-like protein
MPDLQNPIFTDDDKAREYLESIRWPEGPVCPHCGVLEKSSAIKGGRAGLYFCNACRKQYTVTVGTVYERSKVGLSKWLLATYLLSSSKKGMSAHQIHRMLGVTYKTAWFMCHRIREAMIDSNPGPMGGKGKVVEADETYIGSSGYEFHNDKGWQMKRGLGDKHKVFTLVERGGRARSLKVDNMSGVEVGKILAANVNKHTNLMTDESSLYKKAGKQFDRHHKVNHKQGEYAKGFVYTNTVEGYFSIFKRGMIGTYQHCGEQHLQRYLNEFDFRYSNRQITDKERADVALKGAEGKRLMYRRSRLSA